MYSITNTANYELIIEYMECYENTTKEARYPSFKVGPATNYTLAISDRINTNEKDGLKECNGMAFSTHDADKDSRPYVKCAIKRGSAWWFDVCVKIANLNGKLDRCNETTLKSVSWYGNHRDVVGITLVEMKIRRKS
ncbi:ficolin-1-like [Ciona intestinalis]